MATRIAPERLASVADLIYGADRMAGPLAAEQMGQPHHTVWSWLNRRGMPAARADQLADVLDQHAGKMMLCAQHLRREAAAARAPAAQDDASNQIADAADEQSTNTDEQSTNTADVADAGENAAADGPVASSNAGDDDASSVRATPPMAPRMDFGFKPRRGHTVL